jgi:hypothetical protein
MTETALKILEKFGLPTLVAVGLGGLLVYQTMGASEERASHTALLIDQLSDLREKVARLEGKCR